MFRIKFVFLVFLSVFILTGCVSFLDNKENLNKVNNQQKELKNGEYHILVNESELNWYAKRIAMIKPHSGVINIKNGFFNIKNNRITEGKFVINMKTIDVKDGDEKSQINLENHLKSSDFFSVLDYPESTLIIKNGEYKNGEYLITADLRIKNKTNEIVFPAQFEYIDDKLIANANFVIDRTRWDIKYGSNKFFDNLKDRAIEDEIRFSLKIVAVK